MPNPGRCCLAWVATAALAVLPAALFVAGRSRARAANDAALAQAARALIAPATAADRCARSLPTGRDLAAAPAPARSAPLLASWQTVGGCGAGASSGTGAGIKWVGRNVTGGLFHVECQGTYVKTSDGYHYVATAMVDADVGDKWNFGVVVPYLYKYFDDPYAQRFDVANLGLGDVNALVTRRFGAINDTVLTLAVGLPTGTHDAHLVRAENEILRNDRQLGLGKPTAALTLDHVIDNLWGPTVIGAVASWRGGENELGNYRAPSATGYVYFSYLLGSLAPAIGASATGYPAHDRDQGTDQLSPLFSASLNASLEWSTDTFAVLIGGALPYQYDASHTDVNGHARNPWGMGPWVVALGLALSPF
jgi:hypothetical protein